MPRASSANPEKSELREGQILTIRRQQIEQIYAQNANALVGQLLAALIAAFLLWTVTPHWKLYGWFICFSLIQIARYFVSYKFHATPPPTLSKHLDFWFQLHTLFMIFTAASWSFGVLFLWIDGSEFHQVSLFAVIIFPMVATIIGYSFHRASYSIFMVVVIVPIALRFMIEGTPDHTKLGIVALVGFAMLFRITARVNKSSIDALIIGKKYQEQASKLSEEKSKAEGLNQQLTQHAQALQESRTRYRSLSHAAFESIIIHKQGIIVDTNQAAEDLFGYSRSEFDGMHIREIIVPEYYPAVDEYVRNDFEGPYESLFLKKDGSTFPVEVQARVSQSDGEQVRFAVVRDITFRKQAEQRALELTLEHARVELLKTFFQNAAHEFRTPLSVIKTATYAVGHMDEPDKQLERLNKIDYQVERINKLVDDLLLMVKLDTDIEVKRNPVDINATLKLTSNKLKKVIESKQYLLEFDLDNSLPTIKADQRLLSRSFHAILQNAARYTPQGGTITIRTQHDKDSVIVEIQDNGVGMSEDAQAHIFDRFYRVDEAHTDAGFGVGLSIAKSIVELHNGKISAQSQTGKGSAFKITLPIESK